MLLGYEGDVGRARDYTGQWRPLSYSVGHRLRPPSRTLWIDPDYPSGSNPQRLALPGRLPPQKDSLQWTENPRHCAPKLWKLYSQWGLWRERDPKSKLFPSSPVHTPHRHTWESKGAKPHPRNPAQYPGISCRTSQLPPAKANSDWTHLVRPILKVPPLRRNNHIY